MKATIRTLRERVSARLANAKRARRRRGIGFNVKLNSATARLFVILSITLALLVAGFTLSLSFLTPVSPGGQVGLDQVAQLTANGQVVNADFYDYDHRVAGVYVKVAPPPPLSQSGGIATPAPSAKPVLPAHPQTGTFWAQYPASDAATSSLIQTLISQGAHVVVVAQTDKTVVHFIAIYLLPLVILANLFGLIFVGVRGGAGDALSGIVRFGRIGRRRNSARADRLTFADVAGADEAVAELREVRDYLRDPARFAALGAQPPKGVLLFGPPGCGKTLLARAVAGEAEAPFFSISGAEFVESLVGVGAARVRDLFAQVRKVAPAILFIDEIDAAGRRRGGITGGQEEREQTLNQLLIEMDGFEPAAGIVVMGATNRPDILDPALLRPGRFDRQIVVEPPDIDGRHAILELHARKRLIGADVTFDTVARRTPGFTGADLANVVNEAALLAVRFGKSEIGVDELNEAVQRVLSGPQRRGHLLTADERRRTAFHEAGHALVAAALEKLDNVQRISIIARGRTLGGAVADKSLAERAVLTRSELRTELVTCMAGAAAEELILGEPSTGSESDVDRATELAEIIVGRFGMSERLGKVRLVRTEGSEFLGGGTVPSELTAGPVLMELHQEVRRLIDDAERSATDILLRHRGVLIDLAERLEEEESLEGARLEALLDPVRPKMNLVPVEMELQPARTNGHHAGT